ncbi:hypothetical protein [Nocardia miyunensis]|uniref:hypothetical protein n=1 Tax=Nocardia miyunensis TaxID=282684 RepID=UPI0012F48B49|nr:hypothetical protein [Nocardia miyunensis]
MSTFLVSHATATYWYREAVHQLQAGIWVPTEQETTVAAWLSRATRWPTATLPPYEDTELWWRLQQMTTWAGAVRLAIMAGGWPVPQEAGRPWIPAPQPEQTVTLYDILTAVLQLAIVSEQWERQHTPASPIHETPEFTDQLAQMECFFIGLGSIGELFYAIGSGEVSA